MNKNVILLLSVLCVTSCGGNKPVKPVQPEPTEPVIVEPTPEEKAAEIETEVIASNNVRDVLEFYRNIYESHHGTAFKMICTGGIWKYPSDVKDILVDNATDNALADKRCFKQNSSRTCDEYTDYYEDTSDECILARRAAKPSKINYFNYKKYIKNHDGLKSEDDFIRLYDIYNAYVNFGFWSFDHIDNVLISKYTMNKCFTNKELTTAEQEQCEQDYDTFLSDIASGRAQKCSVKYPKQYAAWKKYYSNSGPYQQTEFGIVNLCIPERIYKFSY